MQSLQFGALKPPFPCDIIFVGDNMYRKTYVEVDGNVLENNIKDIKSKYNNYKYYIGVVKANCYSHGFESIKYLIKGGINYLATSSLEEALEVRGIDSKIPILILEPIHTEDVRVASENNISITIDSVDMFKELLEMNLKVKIHLKIDSGMNRFGLKDKNEAKYIYDNCNKNIMLEGVFTQLASGIGITYLEQKNNFESITSLIDLKKIPIVHVDRSLTLEQHDKLPYTTGVRLGIAMYGFNKQAPVLSWKRKLYNKIMRKKNNFVPSILDLKTAFKFYTEVIEIKKIKKGSSIGYKGMYDAKEDKLIAILPVGFADYSHINTSYVAINKKKYPIVAINMDVITVVVDSNVKLYDKVEIFGDTISIRTASRLAHENVYKTLTSVTTRVPRIYKYDK